MYIYFTIFVHRKKGITIRKSNNCLVAYFAIYFNVPLLHNDVDFKMIALHSSLKEVYEDIP